MVQDKESGICPNCEDTMGSVGEPCPERACSRKGYHLIPASLFKVHKEQSKARGLLPDPNLGLLIDRYLLISKLGDGTVGASYLCAQMPLAREVVMKMLSGLGIGKEAESLFEKEARAVSSLYHPNIVQLFDFGIAPDLNAPYMVYEYVRDGRNLADAMVDHEDRGWEPDRVRDISSQILDGLQVVHDKGLVHLNLKPQNIMLMHLGDGKELVKILDLGIIKALQALPEFAKKAPMSATMESVRFIAPEKITKSTALDLRADLYSAGVIMYQLLAGSGALHVKDHRELYSRILNDRFDPLSMIPPGGMADDCLEFFRRALAAKPGMRFNSAAEMKHGFLLVRELTIQKTLKAAPPPAPAVEKPKREPAPGADTSAPPKEAEKTRARPPLSEKKEIVAAAEKKIRPKLEPVDSRLIDEKELGMDSSLPLVKKKGDKLEIVKTEDMHNPQEDAPGAKSKGRKLGILIGIVLSLVALIGVIIILLFMFKES